MPILKLEIIGDVLSGIYGKEKAIATIFFGKPPRRFWVAEINGFDNKYKYSRMFLDYKTDYRYSNSVGSRGKYAIYILRQSKIYQVSEPISWGRTDKYFCVVDKRNNIVKVEEDYVRKNIS